MYVCMYVCMYVMYVCMYACMDVCVDALPPHIDYSPQPMLAQRRDALAEWDSVLVCVSRLGQETAQRDASSLHGR